MPKIDEAAGQAVLDHIIEEQNIDLVISDSLSTLASPEIEKDPTAWMPVQDWALEHRSRGRSFVFAHHDSRGNKPRGHSKKEDILDTMIQLKLCDAQPNEDETALELHFTKSRSFFGADAASMIVRLSTKSGTVEWVAESIKETTRNRVAELLDEGWQQVDIAKELRQLYCHCGKMFCKGGHHELQAAVRSLARSASYPWQWSAIPRNSLRLSFKCQRCVNARREFVGLGQYGKVGTAVPGLCIRAASRGRTWLSTSRARRSTRQALQPLPRRHSPASQSSHEPAVGRGHVERYAAECD